METCAEMSAAEPDAAHSLKAPEFLLSANRRHIENRMVVTFNLERGSGRPLWVERNKHVRPRRQPLQGIHPISDARTIRRFRVGHNIPARPGRAPARHEGLV